MFTSKVVPRLSLLRRATCALQPSGDILTRRVPPVFSASCFSLRQNLGNYSTAADNTAPPRWTQLEPELDEALVPRKLSMSPLESWLSLRYSLPPPPGAVQLLEEESVGRLEEKVLPPVVVPVILEDGKGSATPLSCKNVLKIRRRKMNRHKYRKLQKRIKFLKRRVTESRGKKKQKRFEEDLRRIWTRAGLKKAPEGWSTPKLFIKQHGNKRQ